jgi:hypothetical protein
VYWCLSVCWVVCALKNCLCVGWLSVLGGCLGVGWLSVCWVVVCVLGGSLCDDIYTLVFQLSVSGVLYYHR